MTVLRPLWFAFCLAGLLAARVPLYGQPANTAAKAQPGDVVYALNMNDAEVQKNPLPKGGQWAKEGPRGEPALKVTVQPEDADGMNVVKVPVDLRPFRGMQLALICQARAQDVSKPKNASWLGVKCMLHYRTPAGEYWQNQNGVIGTFDWKELRASAAIGEDATTGTLYLGMQGVSGTAWVSDVKLIAMRVKPNRPPMPPESVVLPPPYKGHNLPRLRGVMSPNQFREKDFADLAQWNVNVIRWQIGRNWGKDRGDRNLDEFDQWLGTKLDEAAKVLDTAQRYGIKVMLDLHGAPGGREPDGTNTMLIDAKYQEHFIKVWQRIATRFKGHPALWAYDLVNEPLQNQPSPAGLGDWLGVQVKAAKAIREIDSSTAISIEVDAWDAPDNFVWLEAVNIPNVIYQVHMYWPGDYTHQGVGNTWGEQSRVTKLLPYPGKSADTVVNKEALRKRLQPVRDFQRTYNAHIFVGEFSVIRWAPGGDQYLSDLIDIFEEYEWDWTYHSFREWAGWSVEHADSPADRNDHPKAAEPTERAKVLFKWYRQNQRAGGQDVK